MTEEEIREFVERLNEDEVKEEAVFGIHQYGGGSDESMISANKSGLQLFAAELLNASLKYNNIIKGNKKEMIPLNYDADWITQDSHTFIQYIDPLEGTRSKPIAAPKQNSIKQEVYKYGCMLSLLLMLVCIVIGFITILKSVFNG